MKNIKKYLIALTVFVSLIGCSPVQEVNIYTSRHYDVDDILYAEFTKKTGIQVNVISGSGGALMERLKSEGKNSPGDVFFTVDAGNLANFQKSGLLQPITSKKIKDLVPKELRGVNDEWVAIAKRARVIFYNPSALIKFFFIKYFFQSLQISIFNNMTRRYIKILCLFFSPTKYLDFNI